MIIRILAGVVALLIVLPVLLLGGELGVQILVPLVMVVCVWEYANMAFPDEWPVPFAWMLAGSGAFYSAILYGERVALLIALAAVILGTQLLILFRLPEDRSRSADIVGRLFTGIVWITLFVFVPLLRELHLFWLMLALVIAWSSDTGAYFAGRFLGKRKLYEAVSPKKTWAGFWGGLITCVGSVFLMNWGFGMGLSVLDCLLISGVAGTLSVCGDLVQSMVKRSFGVKDSGRIMPGHGGLLDRVDSLLYVCPALYVCVWMIQGV